MWIARKVRHNLAYMVFLAIMIGFSSFFTCGVEAFRSKAAIDPGADEVVEEVVDGEEGEE